jgi:pimeloyl-ACP methyl ester carboxylesterase
MKTIIFIIAICCTSFFSRAQNCDLSYSKEIKTCKISDSLTIAYKEKGQGKETILMIHGLGGNLSHWTHNFIENQHSVALDLPAYGLSTMKDFRPETDLLDFYSEMILAFIKKKKLKNVILVGHSMGGQIAIITALKNNKSIKKLVLVAPAGFETFDQNDSKALLGFAKPEIFKSQTEPIIKMSFNRNFYAMPASAETLINDRIMIAKCESFNPYFQAVASGIKGMLDHPVRENLGKIKIPTLVVFGENDDLIPNKYLHKTLTTNQVAEIGQNIPNAKIVLIPEAGHMVMFEQAAKFNEAILSFK